MRNLDDVDSDSHAYRYFGDNLVNAVKTGDVPQARIDVSAQNKV